MKLTAATVQKLRLPPGIVDKIFFDERLSGFGLRVRKGGKRTWIAQYRVGAKQRRIALGTDENLDAAEAYQRAREALSKVAAWGGPANRESGEARPSVRHGRRDGRAIPCGASR